MRDLKFSDTSVGGRIRYARESLSRSQAELATDLGIDRSAIARMEKGTRKVSAAELAALSILLDRSLGWFLQPDTPLVSARRAAFTGEDDNEFQRLLEEIAVAVSWAVHQDIVQATHHPPLPFPSNHVAAERSAEAVRQSLELSDLPLIDLPQAAERLGLLPFTFDVPRSPFDGSMTALEASDTAGRLGVALINGTQSPGRRRFTLAHELGHWIFGDEFDGAHQSQSDNATSPSAREKMIDSFAVHLLLPRSGVTRQWNRYRRIHGDRDATLLIAAEYRTSWSATLGQLTNLGLIDHHTFTRLVPQKPRRGDYELLGVGRAETEQSPVLPRGYSTAVLRAYRDNRITTAKTLDLLFDTFTENQLPERQELPRRRRRRPGLSPVAGPQ